MNNYFEDILSALFAIALVVALFWSLGNLFREQEEKQAHSDFSIPKNVEEAGKYWPTSHYILRQIVLENENKISGSGAYLLFFGGMSIDSEEKPYYLFYTKTSGGGIELQKADSENVVIYEVEDEFTAQKIEVGGMKGNVWVLSIPKDSIKQVVDVNLPIKTEVK